MCLRGPVLTLTSRHKVPSLKNQNHYYFTKNYILQVSIICWRISYFLLRYMSWKYRHLPFWKAHILNILTSATFLWKLTWSKNYLHIMAYFRSKTHHYFPNFIWQVYIICWGLPHNNAVSILKILSLAFPKGNYHYLMNIPTFAVILWKQTWSENYIHIMIYFKNKITNILRKLFSRFQ